MQRGLALYLQDDSERSVSIINCTQRLSGLFFESIKILDLLIRDLTITTK